MPTKNPVTATSVFKKLFGIAFLFAALISPTDPAIVIEIFKKLKIPKELSTLMES